MYGQEIKQRWFISGYDPAVPCDLKTRLSFIFVAKLIEPQLGHLATLAVASLSKWKCEKSSQFMLNILCLLTT